MMPDDEWLLLPAALERLGRVDAQAYLRREIQRRLQHWLRFGELEGLRLLGLPASEAWARLIDLQDVITVEPTGRPIPRLEQHWVADPAIDWESSTLTGPEHWPTILIEISAQLVPPRRKRLVKRATGRPPIYLPEKLKEEAFRLLSLKGVPNRKGAKGWRAQADLERALMSFCTGVFGQECGVSVARRHAQQAISEWKRAQRAKGS